MDSNNPNSNTPIPVVSDENAETSTTTTLPASYYFELLRMPLQNRPEFQFELMENWPEYCRITIDDFTQPATVVVGYMPLINLHVLSNGIISIEPSPYGFKFVSIPESQGHYYLLDNRPHVVEDLAIPLSVELPPYLQPGSDNNPNQDPDLFFQAADGEHLYAESSTTATSSDNEPTANEPGPHKYTIVLIEGLPGKYPIRSETEGVIRVKFRMVSASESPRNQQEVAYIAYILPTIDQEQQGELPSDFQPGSDNNQDQDPVQKDTTTVDDATVSIVATSSHLTPTTPNEPVPGPSGYRLVATEGVPGKYHLRPKTERVVKNKPAPAIVSPKNQKVGTQRREVDSEPSRNQPMEPAQCPVGPSGLRLEPIQGCPGAYHLRGRSNKGGKNAKSDDDEPTPAKRPRGRPKKTKYIPPMIGKKYQAVLPDCRAGPAPKDYTPYAAEQATPVPLWKPANKSSGKDLKRYLTLATSVLLFPEEVSLAYLRFQHNNLAKCLGNFNVLKQTIENTVTMDDRGDVQSVGVIDGEQLEKFMAIEHQLDMIKEMVSGKIDDRGRFINANELFAHRFKNPNMPPVGFDPNRTRPVLAVVKKEYAKLNDASSDHFRLSAAIKQYMVPPKKLTEAQKKIRDDFLLVRRSILYYENFETLFPQVRKLMEKKRHDEESLAEIIYLVTV